MKVRKIMGRFFMIPATFMYMLGIVSRNDLYRFIGSIDPKLRAKLEEPVDQDTEQLKDEMDKEWVEAWKKKALDEEVDQNDSR